MIDAWMGVVNKFLPIFWHIEKWLFHDYFRVTISENFLVHAKKRCQEDFERWTLSVRKFCRKVIECNYVQIGSVRCELCHLTKNVGIIVGLFNQELKCSLKNEKDYFCWKLVMVKNLNFYIFWLKEECLLKPAYAQFFKSCLKHAFLTQSENLVN